MAPGTTDNNFVTDHTGQQTVSTLIQLLAGAVKHHSLYPENHSIATQHIKKIFTTLSSYLKDRQVLHLAVDKTNILYEDNTLYEGKNDESDIAFLLGRDGIEWIEFHREIELWEIQALLRLINLNRRSDIDSDGNIATALWETDFPHIEYKTIDLTALDIPVLNFKSLKIAPEVSSTSQELEEYADKEIQEEEALAEDEVEDDEDQETAGLTLTDPDTALWQLSEMEQFQLDALIRQEEDGADASSIIDILFILLLLQDDLQESLDIMEFLQDRFLDCLQHQQFKYALRILVTLKKINSTDNKLQKELNPLITDLFQAIAKPESLRDLELFFTSPDISVPDNEIVALWEVIKLMPASVLRGLAPLSDKIDLPRFGLSFIGVLEQFGKQSPEILAEVATKFDEKVCLLLLPFIKRMPRDQATDILSSMALHQSPLVRSKTFQLLAAWNAIDIINLFPLIEDPDPLIRQTLFSLIGKQRSPKMEYMLCKHIQEKITKTDEPEYVLACYKAVGQTGSTQCIPFLKKRLFQKSSLGTLFAAGGGAHKKGAALALVMLDQPEAREIVKEGAASLVPDVRSACRQALGGKNAS